MTTELIRLISWGILLGLIWITVMVSLIWAYASKGEAFRKEMIVRYIVTVFLLLMLQIAALAITFLSPLSSRSIHMELTQQNHHTVPPSN